MVLFQPLLRFYGQKTKKSDILRPCSSSKLLKILEYNWIISMSVNEVKITCGHASGVIDLKMTGPEGVVRSEGRGRLKRCPERHIMIT